ncbi:hypothetical protein P170DRAFT_144217 [Aspergillus steynii IBT 23096]|uniref:Uncharacterized protein n=1 Tax=Aspergillus steynii IBT 23096 TaxID=1392250 RepID=A0A2I2GC40_9EURO|nr:uncharacterized protein P170DRAFT_144217 [Aspergillus steynii IBT 23096]PLB50443.1 hypothetical protein P170DRAFT_144217 [Aspergillus steynii IBT 23096]
MSPLADVDDTASFMAAVRALRLAQSSFTSNATTVAVEVSGEQDDTWKSQNGSTGALTSSSVDADGANSASVANKTGSLAEAAKNEISTVSQDALSFATEAGGMMGPPEQEDREHLATFETWGTPAPRSKPAARVRTIILKELPSTWATPAKVLSLIHGGLVESIFVSPMGTAHVRFCDADACQAFYDKYPNGIDLDKSRKATAFVEMGKDVNVVSSQLSFNLSVGATRVVRAVGVDLDVTMTKMIDLATAHNRKIEKIVDSYVPGEVSVSNKRMPTRSGQ